MNRPASRPGRPDDLRNPPEAPSVHLTTDLLQNKRYNKIDAI